MTIEYFNSLDEMEQHEAVWKGSCLGYREEGEFRIVIYKLSDFYAELYYDTEHNVLKKLNALPAIPTHLIPSINPSTLYE